MNKIASTSFFAQASAPTPTQSPVSTPTQSPMQSATQTQPAAQQPSGSSSGLPSWLFMDIPLFAALLTSLGVGTIIATLIKHWSDTRLEHQRQKYAERMKELEAEHERKLDLERYQRIGRKELIEKWESLLDESSLGILDLTGRTSFPVLESHLSKEFTSKFASYISYALQRQMDLELGFSQREQNSLEETYLNPSDTRFRDELKQEVARLKREWELI